MDVIELIHPNMPIIVAAASMLFMLAAALYARPWIAGVISSARIHRELNLLRKKGATVMDHIQLVTKTGDVIHIDHLIVTNAQVIAISTLGYSGDIMGSIRASTWVQETAQGSHRFPNPLKNHETIIHTIQSALGDRLRIRAISAFTAGHLHSDSKDVVAAGECAKAMHAAIEGVTTGAKQQWAANIIGNIALTGGESKMEKERAFIARQGNETHFRIARYAIMTSALLMLIAMILATVRAAAIHGLI